MGEEWPYTFHLRLMFSESKEWKGEPQMETGIANPMRIERKIHRVSKSGQLFALETWSACQRDNCEGERKDFSRNEMSWKDTREDTR